MEENIRKIIKEIIIKYEGDVEGLLDFFDRYEIINPDLISDGNQLYLPIYDDYDYSYDNSNYEILEQKDEATLAKDIIDYSNNLIKLAIEHEDYIKAAKIQEYLKRIGQ